MSYLKKFFISAGILLFSNVCIAAEIHSQCETSSDSGKVFGYCIYQVRGSTNSDILYYLHGLGGSEYDWMQNTEIVNFYKQWKNAPSVIGISYGTLWALAEKNGSHLSGLLEHFVNQAMPLVESKLSRQPAHRILIGLSMGGFNGSQLYLKRPHLFSKVALLCPVITSIGPYSSTSEVYDYIERTGASSRSVWRALRFVRAFYSDAAAWNRSSPILLAKSQLNSGFPALFTSAGTEDRYGIEEGAQEFAMIANNHGVHAESSLVKGDHCSYDLSALEHFLLQ